MAVLNIPPGSIVQFAHDTLFLSVVRLKNGQQVLGLTSRPTDWTIPFTATANGLPESLKLVGPMPASNCEMQWVREADNLIHVTSSADQSTFMIHFVNGSSSACTLMAGSSPDSFFAIRPRDGKFVVQIVNARPDATRFNILLQSYADQYSQDDGRLHLGAA
jgi:hypothetical protein